MSRGCSWGSSVFLTCIFLLCHSLALFPLNSSFLSVDFGVSLSRFRFIVSSRVAGGSAFIFAVWIYTYPPVESVTIKVFLVSIELTFSSHLISSFYSVITFSRRLLILYTYVINKEVIWLFVAYTRELWPSVTCTAPVGSSDSQTVPVLYAYAQLCAVLVLRNICTCLDMSANENESSWRWIPGKRKYDTKITEENTKICVLPALFRHFSELYLYLYFKFIFIFRPSGLIWVRKWVL